MSLLPSVRASLAERFIFNFRLPPKMLATYMQEPWLCLLLHSRSARDYRSPAYHICRAYKYQLCSPLCRA